MKPIMDDWRVFLNEESAPQLSVNDFLSAIEFLQAKRAGEERKKKWTRGAMWLAKTLTGLNVAEEVAKFIGTEDNVVDAVSDIAIFLFKKFSNTPDGQSQNNPLLAMFDLDDDLQAVIDKDVESKFEAYIISKLKAAAGLTPNSAFGMNANAELKKFIRRKYGGTVLTKRNSQGA